MEPPAEPSATSACFINGRRQKLFCRLWQPAAASPKALVFLSHGYAEHCLPYEPLALTLASNNYLVFSHDHVGHGQSEGSRGLIDSFDTYVDDVFSHVEAIKQNYPKMDCFICGHSMGGAIAILAGLRKPEYFKGVILIGPCVATHPQLVTPFKVTVAKILRRLAPQFPIGSLDLSTVSRCPKVLEMLRSDPFRYHGYAKAGFGAALLDACQYIQEKTSSIRYPFLIVQGEADKLCTPEGAFRLYEKAASHDKTLKMYPEAYHNLLYEPDGVAEQVTSEIVEWLIARTQ